VRQLRRLPRYLDAALTVVTARNVRWLYMAIDANNGIYVNAAYAVLARLRGLRIIAHHHNYAYIVQPMRRMALLTTIAGHDAVHVTQCDLMSRELKQQYRHVHHTVELSNIYALSPGAPKSSVPERFTLGHLSNLCVAKGLPTVVECLRLLRRAGVDAQLWLAGPADREATALIAAARAEFGGAVEHLGPLYGYDKQKFYQRIDVFLFPTRYRNETQGIVNLEAMAAGAPVIAYGQCCIPSDLQRGGGVAVPPGAVFEDVALPHLLRWAADPDALRCASLAARRRSVELRRDAEGQMAGLLRAVL
jgi:glycosyltransferase involved in cell wall biosynthesis